MKYLLLLYILLIATTGNAQIIISHNSKPGKKSLEDYYKEGYKLYNEGKHDKAEKVMKDIIHSTKEHWVYGGAVETLVDIYLLRGDTTLAFQLADTYIYNIHLDTMGNRQDDLERFKFRLEHDLYKSKIIGTLKDYYLKQQNFREAIRYSKLQDQGPSGGFCAWGSALEDANKFEKYRYYYMKLEDTAGAIATLLPIIYNMSSEVIDNKDYYRDFEILLSGLYTDNEIRNELREAEKHFTLTEKAMKNIFEEDAGVYYGVSTTLFNNDIYIYSSPRINEETGAAVPESKVLADALQAYRNSNLYKYYIKE